MTTRLTLDHRLAERMANGCPSVIEAARLMKITVADAEKLWGKICRSKGRQAQ